MDTIVTIVVVIIIYLIFKPKEFHLLESMGDFLSKNRFLKKIRNSFSTEFMWRCYVVTQGAFLLIMIGLAHEYKSGWYFFFPRIEYDELDESQWWIGVLYYFIVPYVIVRTVDWVLQSKKSD